MTRDSLTGSTIVASPFSSFAASNLSCDYRWLQADTSRCGIFFGELRAEEEDAGRIVDPKQEKNHGTGRTETGRRALSTQIKRQAKFPNLKEHCGKERADPYILPSDFYIGKDLEDRSEE